MNKASFIYGVTSNCTCFGRATPEESRAIKIYVYFSLSGGGDGVGTFAMAQLLEISRLVVGFAVLPTFPQDADPLEGQGAEDGRVLFALVLHVLVVVGGPRTVHDCLPCP